MSRSIRGNATWATRPRNRAGPVLRRKAALDGESIWDIKRHLGWLAPELQLHFNDQMTCFEALASGFHDTLGLFHRPTPRQRQAVYRWLARFDLSPWAATPLFGLSAGLRRIAEADCGLGKRSARASP